MRRTTLVLAATALSFGALAQECNFDAPRKK